jgi:hypothetical protein
MSEFRNTLSPHRSIGAIGPIKNVSEKASKIASYRLALTAQKPWPGFLWLGMCFKKTGVSFLWKGSRAPPSQHESVRKQPDTLQYCNTTDFIGDAVGETDLPGLHLARRHNGRSVMDRSQSGLSKIS